VAQSCSVLIAATDVQPAFRQRAGALDGDVLLFSDGEALRALEAITSRRPRLVALERLFAATPRGAALINRIKADPALTTTEIRVLAHDSDYSRVLPRSAAAGAAALHATAEPSSHPAPVAAPVASAQSVAAADAPAAATLDPGPLDQIGTRAAPRYKTQKIEVLIDGNPATLVDLSVTGAQVVSVTILKPNQRVRMAFSDEHGMVRFNAAIAWAQFEIPPRIGPQYRAGIEFVDADPDSIDAFCSRHLA
jgi:PilZ domain-containing protein